MENGNRSSGKTEMDSARVEPVEESVAFDINAETEDEDPLADFDTGEDAISFEGIEFGSENLDDGVDAIYFGPEELSEDLDNNSEDLDANVEDLNASFENLRLSDPGNEVNAQVVSDMADLQFGTEKCYICFDDVCHAKVLQLGCGEHWICHDCIAVPFELAIQNESHYPQRCCDWAGPLRIEDFEHLLAISNPDLAAQYTFKLEEYHMDIRFRRYCGAEECHCFLSPEIYERSEDGNLTTADCPKCSRATCIFCTKLVSKTEPHDCEPNANKVNEDYSKEARFKYCPYCRRPGLLDEGCNHVTCECGAQWCFVCLRKWNNGVDHGDCGQYNDPEYDNEGYDLQFGLHRDTGLDREGFSRDGFNVAGFDREGNKVTDFARLERDRLHAPAPRPAGFLDVDDENLEETAILLFIQEREAGVVHETDNLEELLALRFPGFRANNNLHENDNENVPALEEDGDHAAEALDFGDDFREDFDEGEDGDHDAIDFGDHDEDLDAQPELLPFERDTDGRWFDRDGVWWEDTPADEATDGSWVQRVEFNEENIVADDETALDPPE